jgi:Tol biopolymer transport system component
MNLIPKKRRTPAGVDLGTGYFTSNSLLADDRRMILVKKEKSVRDVCLLDLATGETRQLTHTPTHTPKTLNRKNEELLENDCDNILRETVAADPDTGEVLFVRGRFICKTDLAGREKILAKLPEGTATSATDCREGKFLVATMDTQAFADYDGTNGHVVDQRIQALGLASQLRAYDTETGEEVLRETVLRGWVTHVQFNPADTRLILYNHEWCADGGIRRMWLFDGRRHILVRPEGDGRSRQDWTCHEMWTRDGRAILYHGGYHKGPMYLGRATLETLRDPRRLYLREIPFPPAYGKYGHFSMGNGAALVTDGYYQEPGEAPAWGGKWISALLPNWEAQTLRWVPLAAHNSDWVGQESHPHPIFNHAGDKIYYNSNEEGYRAVYELDISGLEGFS